MVTPTHRPARKNWLEWLVFSMSIAVIALIVGTLVRGMIAQEEAPAKLEVFLGDARKEGSGFVVPVVVRNRGGQPAAAARVEVVLTAPGFSERGGFDLSYSPAGSTRRGEVPFSQDPDSGVTRARIVGFELP